MKKRLRFSFKADDVEDKNVITYLFDANAILNKSSFIQRVKYKSESSLGILESKLCSEKFCVRFILRIYDVVTVKNSWKELHYGPPVVQPNHVSLALDGFTWKKSSSFTRLQSFVFCFRSCAAGQAKNWRISLGPHEELKVTGAHYHSYSTTAQVQLYIDFKTAYSVAWWRWVLFQWECT